MLILFAGTIIKQILLNVGVRKAKEFICHILFLATMKNQTGCSVEPLKPLLSDFS
jgi:hypothetical protein